VASNFVNAALTGVSTYNGTEIGFRGVPLTVQNGAYTFVVGDAGKCRAKTNTTAYTYTVPASTFAAGDVLTVVNTGTSGSITLAQGAGMTLQLSGSTTTGNRTVAAGGVVSIYFDSATHAMVGGTALS